MSYWKMTINNDNEISKASLYAYYVVGIVPNVKFALQLCYAGSS